jgi:predicted XRE-type DNA-binding protein
MQSSRPEPAGHITKGNVLDDLGFDEQTALELKLKTQLHEGILRLIRQHKYSPRELERILDIQQPHVSELLTGKLSTMSVKRLLWYADRLGGDAKVKVSLRSRAA